jgi:hypothetical protein
VQVALEATDGWKWLVGALRRREVARQARVRHAVELGAKALIGWGRQARERGFVYRATSVNGDVVFCERRRGVLRPGRTPALGRGGSRSQMVVVGEVDP